MAKITDFKLGDKIRRKSNPNYVYPLNGFYYISAENVLADDWELAKTKKVGYFVLYKENEAGGFKTTFLDVYYNSEEEAIEDLKNFGTYIKIVKVEWEE